MSLISILSHTPVWVWFLFLFLVSRGVKALKPRKISPQRMLMLPLIFFVWAIYSIFVELKEWHFAFIAFTLCLILGIVFGSLLAQQQPRAWLDNSTKLIYRPGSPLPLILVCISFLLKYMLSVILAHRPDYASTPSFCTLYGAVSGIVDGIFWGATLLQFKQAFMRKQLEN